MTIPSPPTRFIALDIHRKYLVVGAVDPHQQIVLSPRRFGFARLLRRGRNPFRPLVLPLSVVDNSNFSPSRGEMDEGAGRST